MAVYKMTMLFELATNVTSASSGGRVGGWSESWYYDGVLGIGRPLFGTLCARRAAMLPTGARIVGQRFQQVSPNVGASQVASTVFPGSASTAADVPQMAILVKVLAGGGLANIRNWAMRGLPDARVIEGEYAPSVAFTTAFAQFVTALAPFSFRAIQLDAPQQEINFIDENGIMNLLDTMTLGDGDLVKVMRTRDENGQSVSGIFKVGTGTTSSVKPLVNWTAGFTNGGRARKQVVIYPLIGSAGATLGRVVVKKVGRPFSGYRGRRSARR